MIETQSQTPASHFSSGLPSPLQILVWKWYLEMEVAIWEVAGTRDFCLVKVPEEAQLRI